MPTPSTFQTLGSAVSPLMHRIAQQRSIAQRAAVEKVQSPESPDVLRGAVRCDEPEKARQR